MGSTHDPEIEAARSGRARGGIERAKRLTAAERSASASKAAKARWSAAVHEVACGSPDRLLRFGDIEIECYVLADGTRVVTQASMLTALGKHRNANYRRQESEAPLPTILQGKSIYPFISEELREKSKPIIFRRPTGGRATGYNAEIIPDVCDVFLAARAAGALPHNQIHVAAQSEILVRGLARVGIVALVDEATGYQALRAKNALAEILEAFIEKELQRWVKTFPDDFYDGMFRLRGLEYPTSKVKRPQYFGVLTNDIVYKRLAPGVLRELKTVAPKGSTGKRKAKLFQNLTSNVGYPQLREHLGSVVTLMKLSDTWEDFMQKLDQLHPRYGDTIPIDFPDDGKGL